MRAIDRLLVPLGNERGNERGNDVVEEELREVHEYSTCFWVSYTLFVASIGALSMWAFFKYVVMN